MKDIKEIFDKYRGKHGFFIALLQISIECVMILLFMGVACLMFAFLVSQVYISFFVELLRFPMVTIWGWWGLMFAGLIISYLVKN